jgi:hypothetical protein
VLALEAPGADKFDAPPPAPCCECDGDATEQTAVVVAAAEAPTAATAKDGIGDMLTADDDVEKFAADGAAVLRNSDDDSDDAIAAEDADDDPGDAEPKNRVG